MNILELERYNKVKSIVKENDCFLHLLKKEDKMY
jgi:hypothetical protein